MITIKGLCHVYRIGTDITVGADNINLAIPNGEIVALIGPSGAGKSTLLKCINRLLEPYSGNIFIGNDEILRCSHRKAQAIRRRIGMVFQDFNLLKRSTVVRNVLLGRLGYVSTFRSLFGKYAYTKYDVNISMECLRKVGIQDLADRRVETLSGGQQQRVGIARSLAQNPNVILADEPVSNIDPAKKKEIMDLLLDIHIKEHITTIISVHDVKLAKKYTDRIIGLKNGKIVFDGNPKGLTGKKVAEIFN
ncbi:MAG: phosphonate ABC transporter ATP-binding protein [Candidatus Brocadiales bacterium]|nr:phosphonate ABC transporter ATP-binding protein [Candidatus Brocadiales bacterium]